MTLRPAVGAIFFAVFTCSLLTNMTSSARSDEPAKQIKVGIIGLDTSHCVAFTKAMNDPEGKGDLAKVEVVAAFPAGSPDIPSSRDRVEGYTKEMRNLGVGIAPSIEALLPKVDAVLLESVDGRPHLEQVKQVFAAGKPVFVDKPVAGTLADAVEIFRLAKEHKVPCFSSSSLRFSPGILKAKTDEKLGGVLGCDAYGPCALEEHHPDLFWYGIHGVETLFTIMGTGCESVARTQTPDGELVVGVWKGGRIGTFRGIRAGKSDYGATVFGKKAITQAGSYSGYQPLVERIATFFVTHEPPVSAEETLEIYAFMEAADASKRSGGAPVTIESVMAKAQPK